jgi:hypothetical protein
MAASEDDPTVAPTPTVVKHFLAAVDSCPRTARGSRGQGRQPRAARAKRNRGRAQSLERTSCEPHDDRATAEDRDVELRAFNAALLHEFRRPRFPAETRTAWRERPPRWPRAWQAKRSKMVVAHATVLRLTPSPTSSLLAGGTERRPSHPFSNSQH